MGTSPLRRGWLYDGRIVTARRDWVREEGRPRLFNQAIVVVTLIAAISAAWLNNPTIPYLCWPDILPVSALFRGGYRGMGVTQLATMAGQITS